MSVPLEFVNEVLSFVVDLPDELIERVANALCDSAKQEWPRLQAAILRQIPQQHVHERTLQFLHYWQAFHSEVKPEAVALALSTAAQAASQHRAEQSLELVWTGPESRYVTLRRTDQALLQVINEAQHTLRIVSFAVYKIDFIARALINAAHRGVDIAIYLETPETSANKMAFNTVQALGQEISDYVKICVWPAEKRPRSPDNRCGALHAKLALADGHVLLISSANLTEYAMSLNMELGLLIRGGGVPTQVEAHLTSLEERGVFERLT